MKLTGYNYACNSVTNFEYEVHPKNGNGNHTHVNPLKLARKKFVKSHQVNLFLAGFSHLEPLWSGGSNYQVSAQFETLFS